MWLCRQNRLYQRKKTIYEGCCFIYKDYFYCYFVVKRRECIIMDVTCRRVFSIYGKVLKKAACMMCPMFLNVSSHVFYLCLLENMWTELAEIKIWPAQTLNKAMYSMFFAQLGPTNPPLPFRVYSNRPGTVLQG